MPKHESYAATPDRTFRIYRSPISDDRFDAPNDISETDRLIKQGMSVAPGNNSICSPKNQPMNNQAPVASKHNYGIGQQLRGFASANNKLVTGPEGRNHTGALDSKLHLAGN